MKAAKQNEGRTSQRLAVQFPAGATQDFWHVRVKSVGTPSRVCADVVVASYLDHLSRQPRLTELRLSLAIPTPV